MPGKRLLLLAALLLPGCQHLLEEPKLATVSSNPFAVPAESKVARVNYQPADEKTSMRVDAVGRKLLQDNPHSGLNPKATFFATIGNAPQPEVFHVGTHMVYVTDGLVRRCNSDAELAAVLALELGKIVAQREAAATPAMRSPERLPPIQVPIGNAGQFTNPDLVHQVELAKYEKVRPRGPKSLPRPDPEALARDYLEKAGFLPADLDAVQPLLHAAQNHVTYERQFKGILTPGAWTP
jgi:hypothetical protein